MQKFNKFNANETLDKAIPKIYEDILSVASSFSGDAFPTDNLQVGMTCYRTDEKKGYTLISNDNNDPVWQENFDANFVPGVAEFDSDGNEINKHYISVNGGRVNAPIKNSNSPVNNDDYANKAYVDASVSSMAGELSKQLESARTATKNALSTSIADVKENGVNKLITPRHINGNAFDGTNDIAITPSQISTGSTQGSTTGTRNTSISASISNISPPSREQNVKSITPNKLTFSINTLTQSPAIGKGEYTLEQVLNMLIANCHKHGNETQSATATLNCWSNCNCNCDCTCDCGDDGGSA